MSCESVVSASSKSVVAGQGRAGADRGRGEEECDEGGKLARPAVKLHSGEPKSQAIDRTRPTALVDIRTYVRTHRSKRGEAR